MTNIIQFETAEMGAARFFRENREGFIESAKRMQAVMDNPNKSDRAKLEARMAKALFEFDDAELERTSKLLERLHNSGLSVINGGK